MFNLMMRLLAKSEILPVLNAQGSAVYPNLNSIQNDGLNSLPNEDKVRIVARNDALL